MSRTTQTLTLVLQDAITDVVPYAQDVEFAQWEDGSIPFLCVLASTGNPANCTGGAFILTARSSYLKPNPPALSREATATDFSVGTGYFPIGSDDTGAMNVNIYEYDIDFIDSSGKRWQVLPVSGLKIAEAIGIPNTPVTVPSSQQPLAQGPRGYPTDFAAYDNTKSYAVGEGVSYTSGSITSSYICTVATTGGVVPTNTGHWLIMASGGGGVPDPTGAPDGEVPTTVSGAYQLRPVATTLQGAYTGGAPGATQDITQNTTNGHIRIKANTTGGDQFVVTDSTGATTLLGVSTDIGGGAHGVHVDNNITFNYGTIVSVAVDGPTTPATNGAILALEGGAATASINSSPGGRGGSLTWSGANGADGTAISKGGDGGETFSSGGNGGADNGAGGGKGGNAGLEGGLTHLGAPSGTVELGTFGNTSAVNIGSHSNAASQITPTNVLGTLSVSDLATMTSGISTGGDITGTASLTTVSNATELKVQGGPVSLDLKAAGAIVHGDLMSDGAGVYSLGEQATPWGAVFANTVSTGRVQNQAASYAIQFSPTSGNGAQWKGGTGIVSVPWTLDAWFQWLPNGLVTNTSKPMIFATGSTASSVGAVINSSGTVDVIRRDGTVIGTGSANVADGAWHAIAFEVDSGNNWSLYLDGNLDASGSGISGFRGRAVFIGDPSDGSLVVLASAAAFVGSVTQIRLSNIVRYAAPYTPVQSYTVDANTLNYWPCNDGSGTTAVDLANGQSLTVSSMQTASAYWGPGVSASPITALADLGTLHPVGDAWAIGTGTNSTLYVENITGNSVTTYGGGASLNVGGGVSLTDAAQSSFGLTNDGNILMEPTAMMQMAASKPITWADGGAINSDGASGLLINAVSANIAVGTPSTAQVALNASNASAAIDSSGNVSITPASGKAVNGVTWAAADASDVQLTTTGATTIATYTTPAAGNYVINLYYRVATGATNTNIAISWTDGGGAQSQTVINASQAVGSYRVAPSYVNCTNASAITVTATAGTANQLYVSATISKVT